MKIVGDDDKSYAREVGRRIIEARRDLGMSQQELADLIHLTDRSVQAYESGEVIPYRKAKDLSDVLGKPISWILHGDKAETPPGELVPVLQEIAANVGRIVQHLERDTPEAV